MGLALLLAFLLPARSARASAADELCGAAGYSSGCIGTYTPVSEPSRESGSREREPSCDAACRQRDAEDRRYALDHMEQPRPVEQLDPVAEQLDRAVREAADSDQRDDKACLAALAAAASPLELGESAAAAIATVDLGPALVVVAGALAAGALLKAYLEGRVPAISQSRPSTETCPEAAVSADPCDDVRGKICDGSTDCNEARTRQEAAKGCLDRRLAELDACGQKGAPDALRNDYGRAFNSCNRAFEELKRPLDAAVESSCKDQGYTCAEHETWPPGKESCDRATGNLALAQACKTARETRRDQCFEGASGHEQTFPDAQKAVDYCAAAVQAHCQGARP